MKQILKATILSIDKNETDRDSIQKTYNKCRITVSINKQDGTTVQSCLMVTQAQADCLSVGSVINVSNQLNGYSL